MVTSPQTSADLPSTDVLFADLIRQTHSLLNTQAITNPHIIGIHTGGVWVAQALATALEAPLGKLDISFYRDDFTQHGLHPMVKPSELPFDVTGKNILLVDDVLMSGRTVRAALNEIFDYGRPASVKLICLCALAGRQLPIQPDVCVLHIDLDDHQYLQLSGPEPLQLTVTERAKSE